MVKKYDVKTEGLVRFGVYYDNPKKVEWAKCRSATGFILEEIGEQAGGENAPSQAGDTPGAVRAQVTESIISFPMSFEQSQVEGFDIFRTTCYVLGFKLLTSVCCSSFISLR